MTTCAHCPKELTDRSPSPDFCSLECQDGWHQARSSPWPWSWPANGTSLPATHEGLVERIRNRIAEQELGGAA